jgi:hypothetical protein
MRELFAISAGAVRLAALVLLSLLVLGVALADEADPPDRVARLSYLQGSVSLEPAGQQDWIGAELNRPLTTSDKLWSDMPSSRAELDMGGAVIRVGSNTGFSFLNLDDNVAQMQVTAGTVIVHVREMLEGQTYEIDTPNVALVLDQAGSYRVEVNDAGNATVVKVSDGQAEVSDGGQPVPVNNQEMMTFLGTGQVSTVPSSLGAPDGFDDWSYERDREFDQSASRQYVGDDVEGTQDLDDNGEWQNTPDYGPVWVPTAVAVGWAPYSFGHWAWISPWGWTWVDNSSWGFAPFHYGRWARRNNSWCWVPGPRQNRAIYAPAMVGWVGGVGTAAVGWFPLAPREAYVPGYRASERYLRAINTANTTIVDHNVATTHYANSGVPGAVTTVPQSVFTSAEPVNAHKVSLSSSQLAHLAPAGRPPFIAPIRQSILGGPAVGLARRPPPALLNRTVVARVAPPAAPGVRVRMVGPQTQQVSRAVQPRPGATAGSMQQPRPSLQSRAAATMPPASAPEVDMRTLAERERALEQKTLPPSQPLRYERPVESQSYQSQQPAERAGSPSAGEPPPERVFRDDRPPSASQPESSSRAPATTYSRPVDRPPQAENRAAEERRSTPAPAAPATHYSAPPPAHATTPQQHAPAPGHSEDHPPRTAPHPDQPH